MFKKELITKRLPEILKGKPKPDMRIATVICSGCNEEVPERGTRRNRVGKKPAYWCKRCEGGIYTKVMHDIQRGK